MAPSGRGPVPLPEEPDLPQQILDLLETKPVLKSSVDFPEVSQKEIKAAIDRLSSREMVTYSTIDTEQVQLTEEGRTICNEGSHEYKVWDAVRRAGKIEIKSLVVSCNGLLCQ